MCILYGGGLVLLSQKQKLAFVSGVFLHGNLRSADYRHFSCNQAQSVDCYGQHCNELWISYYEGSSYYNYYSGASFSCEETWSFRQEESEGKRNDACSNYQFRPYFLYMGAGEIFFIRYGYEWIIVYCILLLIINGWCIYVWHDVAANRELKHRIELMEQQNELTHQYYEEMEKNYNRSRKIIHDIRNHLHALEQSAKMEDSRYFEDVHGMLNSLGLKFYSDNKMLNII